MDELDRLRSSPFGGTQDIYDVADDITSMLHAPGTTPPIVTTVSELLIIHSLNPLPALPFHPSQPPCLQETVFLTRTPEMGRGPPGIHCGESDVGCWACVAWSEENPFCMKTCVTETHLANSMSLQAVLQLCKRAADAWQTHHAVCEAWHEQAL